MSLAFVHLFFPYSTYLLNRYLPQKFNRLFPPELQQRCAPRSHEVLRLGDGDDPTLLVVRWPSLVPITIIGIMLGLYGYRQLQRPLKRGTHGTPSWALAMGFYALMNLAALGCHCLVPRSSPLQVPLVSLDIAATACSAFCAAYACLINELGDTGQSLHCDAGSNAKQERPGQMGDAQARPLVETAVPKKGQRSGRARHVINLLTWCGIFNTSAFWGLQVPLMPELLYLGTSLFAAVVVGRYVLRRAPRVGRQAAWTVLLFAGAAAALLGLELDAPLCRAGLHLVANTATIVFTGCHVIMAALLLYVKDDLLLRRQGQKAGHDE